MRTSTTHYDESCALLAIHHKQVKERTGALAAYDAIWDSAPAGQDVWETMRMAARVVRAMTGERVLGATAQGERQQARLAAAERAGAYEGMR